MARQTPIYNFTYLQIGDILFPGLDEQNMKSVDSQLSGLIRFVGPGVLSGWEITSLKRPADTDITFDAIMSKRYTLAEAIIGTELYQLYRIYGAPNVNEDNSSPSVEKIWSRMIVVSEGRGVVGLYSAQTNSDAYLLLPEVNAYTEYIAWAQSGLCLVSDGLANISYTDAADDTFDTVVRVATYLGTLGVNKVVLNDDDYDFTVSIEYTTDRKNLNNLASALEDGLNKYYYRHVHAGLPEHPSKIQLSTEKILTATVPSDYVSTPFFSIKDENGDDFTWSAADYGIPKVYLGNDLLPTQNYTLEPTSGRIYLKNSLPINSIIQIILPLSTQVKLIANDINSEIYIELVEETNTTTVFKWDDLKYQIPVVYFKEELIPISQYTITSSLGQIVFVAGAIAIDLNTSNSDLVVELTLLGSEIEGVLSGARIENIDASSFSRGTLDINRIHNLDHVGEVRFMETASLNPTSKLYDSGNHSVFYPEVSENKLQYNSYITCIYDSVSAGTILIGTKHGLYSTSDFVTIYTVSSWSPDMGIPKVISDNIYDLNQRYYPEVYVLTEEGKVYYSNDNLSTWSTLKLPSVALYGNQSYTPKITAFVVSTDRTKIELSTTYNRIYYVGTEGYGLFKATIQENQTDTEWQWQRFDLETYDEFVTITSLEEISTINKTVYSDTYTESTDRSVYVATEDGLYFSTKGSAPCKKLVLPGIDFSGDNYVKQIRKTTGDGPNNIIWITANKLYFTRDAEQFVVRDDVAETTTTYWVHPYEVYLPYDKDILSSQMLSVDVATNSNTTLDIASVSFPTIYTERVDAECGLDVLDGVPITSGDISRVLFTHFVDTETNEYAKYNGVYTYTSSSASGSMFTKASDYIDTKLTSDLFILETNDYQENLWYVAESSEISTIGVTTIIFPQIWYGPLVLNSNIYTVDVASDTSNTDIVFNSFDSDTNYLYINKISEINGVSLVSNTTTVLFTQFTLASLQQQYNGIYLYKGDVGSYSLFLRTNLFVSYDLVQSCYITDNSQLWWFAGIQSPTINVSNIVFNAIQYLYTPTADTFLSVHEAPTSLAYYVASELGLYTIKNYKTDSVWQEPVVVSKGWKSYSRSSLTAIYETDILNNLVSGSKLGLWSTSSNGENWNRPYQMFTYGSSVQSALPIPSIYSNGEQISYIDTWFVDYESQAFVFYTTQYLWSMFVYEQDYTQYYVDPWSTSSDIIVYEDNVATNSSYSANSTLGRITFASFRQPDTIIKITILRQGAFISNVGSTTHEELERVLIVQDSPATVLLQDLLPEAQVILVKDKTAVPVGTEYLELRLGTSLSQTRERINVSVDLSGNIKIVKPRTSTVTFTKDNTGVYLAYIGKQLGIEDNLTLLNTNQTYHLNSLTGVNVLQLSMSTKDIVPSLYEDFNYPTYLFNFNNQTEILIPAGRYKPSLRWVTKPITVVNDLGPKNALFLEESDMSGLFSDYKPYTGFEPAATDFAIYPRVFYYVESPSVTAENMRVYTDKGIWLFDGDVWVKQSELDNATSIYYVKEIDGILSCGTNTGMWEYNGASWIMNPLYTQVIYDYTTATWFGGTCWVVGKNDGVAFVWQEKDSTTFTSDSFDLVNGINVYSLFKSYFIRIEEEKQVKYDAMYLCTENGLFVVTNGDRGTTYSAFLVGREIFGDGLLTHSIETITGTETVPVKIYKIFQNGRTIEFKPIILLTNNGVYIVRGWRWADPAIVDSLDFTYESHNLEGISCYCYLNTSTIISPPEARPTIGSRTEYVILVGTNKNVWRSYDDGYTWSPCEKFTDYDLVVYDLTTYTNSTKTIILAATNDGLYTSEDNGDYWYKTGESNVNASYNSSISNGISFISSNWIDKLELSQSFTTSTSLLVTDIALYVETRGTPAALIAGNDNTLEINIYAADSNDKPTGSPLNTYPAIIRAKDIEYVGFKSVPFLSSFALSASTKYCIVAKEIVTIGGSSIFYWFTSSGDTGDLYNGQASKSIQGAASWTDIENRDFYFKIYYSGSEVPIVAINQIDFQDGEWRGCKIVNSKLTTDLKLAAVIIIDDSKSTLSSEDFGTTDFNERILQKKLKIKNLIDRLYYQTSNDTYVDIWVYGRNIKSITSGFKSNKWDVLNYLEILYDKGTQSSLFEASANAIGGLNYQSLVDAKYATADYEATTEDINWAKEYIPAIFIISDGDNSSSGSAEDVAITANSVWDTDGTPINIFGWGPYKKSEYLRIMSENSNGIFFDINDIKPYIECDITGNNLTTTGHGLVFNDEIIFSYSCHNINSVSHYYAIPIDNYTFQISNSASGAVLDLSSIAADDPDFIYFCKPDDWSVASESLDYLGQNSIFKSLWYQNYDFVDPTWVKSVYSNISASGTNGSCNTEIRYSKDRFNWTNWITIPSSVSGYIINDLLYSLQFKINIINSWNGIYAIPQTVNSLNYTSITPSRKLYLSERKENNGMIYQYLFSAHSELPPTSRLTWGLCRGDSVNFVDYEILYNGRNSVLPNRQSSIRYTPEIIVENLETVIITGDGIVNTYQVLTSTGSSASWLSTDVVIVTIQNQILDPAEVPYSTNAAKGWVILPIDFVLPTGTTFNVTIITPEELANVTGELAYTYDYRTYYATNGAWVADASVIVLKNNYIVRGGYWVSSEYGAITFNHELESSDIISIYIQHSQYYRIGAEVLNYDAENEAVLNKIGLYFTELTNSDLLNQYANTIFPTLTDKPIIMSNSGSILSPLYISYDYYSSQNAEEQGTVIRWWKNASGSGVITEIVDYRNRIAEPLSDVNVSNGHFAIGDKLYVEVIPSDGAIVPKWISINELDTKGLNVWYSEELTITGGEIPLVWDLKISSPSSVSKYISVEISTIDSTFTTLDNGLPIAHGFSQYDKVGFTGTLPSGITTGAAYYVLISTDNTKFQVSTAKNNDTAVLISGASASVKVFSYVVTVVAGENLTADYKFYDPSVPSDSIGELCEISWYADDSLTPFYVGKTTDYKTIKNQTIYYSIVPKTATMTGIAVLSDSVTVL